MSSPDAATLRRIWDRIDMRSPSECWIWTAGLGGRNRTPTGYAVIQHHGRQYRVTRLLWAHLHGPIPPGMYVCHTCDTPSCCNPTHLFLGTPKDNARDKVRKGRMNHSALVIAAARRRAAAINATRHYRLTADQVRAIRHRSRSGETQAALGVAYGVSMSLIGLIVRGQCYRSIVDRDDDAPAMTDEDKARAYAEMDELFAA